MDLLIFEFVYIVYSRIVNIHCLSWGSLLSDAYKYTFRYACVLLTFYLHNIYEVVKLYPEDM